MNVLRLIAAVLSAVLLTAGVAPELAASRAIAQEGRQRVTLGVLRSDGILLPFAAFDGRRWSTPWPSNVSGVDLPLSPAAVPRRWWGGEAPAEWRLLPVDPAIPAAALSMTALRLIPIGQSRRLGVRTTFSAAPPAVPLFEFPYPKAGLAVAGDVAIRPLTTAPTDDAGARRLVDVVRAAIDEVEEEMVTRLALQAAWRHPFGRQARQKIAPQVEAWYTAPLPDAGVRVSYVEIVKPYPPRPEDKECGLLTFVSGWVYEDERRRTPRTDLRATITYCDRDRVSYMLPFGHMTLGRRTYWVFQLSGRMSEWYIVAEVSRDRTRHVAQYQAGILTP